MFVCSLAGADELRSNERQIHVTGQLASLSRVFDMLLHIDLLSYFFAFNFSFFVGVKVVAHGTAENVNSRICRQVIFYEIGDNKIIFCIL